MWKLSDMYDDRGSVCLRMAGMNARGEMMSYCKFIIYALRPKFVLTVPSSGLQTDVFDR